MRTNKTDYNYDVVVLVRGSLKERVEYADEMMEHIMDSADRPMEVSCHREPLFMVCGEFFNPVIFPLFTTISSKVTTT